MACSSSYNNSIIKMLVNQDYLIKLETRAYNDHYIKNSLEMRYIILYYTIYKH